MDFLIDFLLLDTVQVILKVVVMVFVLVMPAATLLTLMERKWSAFIQDRVGPNRANIGAFRGRGLVHIVADGLKSIVKEDFIPEGTNKFLFTLAPMFGFVAAMVMFAVIPIAGPIFLGERGIFHFQIADLNVGLLVIFAFTSLGVYGAVLAGWSTNNKYAMLGSIRASAQMISYEVFMGLSLVGLFMVYGSLQLTEIVAGQNEYWFGWIPKWGVFTQPLAFFIFFAASIAETKRAPFDAPEAESELIAGYFLEYSGMRWAAFMVAEYVAVVGVAMLMTTLFFGSYHIPWLQNPIMVGNEMVSIFQIPGMEGIPVPQWLVVLLQLGSFTVKTLFFCWMQLMIRWTIPKFRFDQTMSLGWKKLLPLSLANVVVTGLVILVADSLF